MCGSKVNSYTGCGHTFKELWKCRPVRDFGQPICRHWDALNREHPQALPQNCPDCERRPFDASRWREIGIQPQDPVFTRIGSVADRYVPTPPPPPPASRHPSGYVYGEDQTRSGAGADPTPSEIDRRVLNWGRDVPHPTGYDTRYTPASPERGVYRRTSSQDNLHSSSRAGGSAPHHHHHHHGHHRRHHSSGVENSTHHQPSSTSRVGSSAPYHQPSSSSRIGSSAPHHHGPVFEHTSRQSTNGTHLYSAPHQPSTRAGSHTVRQSSVGAQQALAPRRRLDIGPVHPGYEDADDYNRRLSEYHYNNNQPTRTLPMRPLSPAHPAPPARSAHPSVSSVAGSSRAQRYVLESTRIVEVTRTTLTRTSIYRPAPQFQQQPAPPSVQQPVQQPDFSNTGTSTGTGTGTGTSTGTLTNGGSVSGYSPTATRRGAGSHGGSGGMSYFRGPAPGPGTNRRIY
ncbi:hypothetical protein D6C85_08177 [Aureobasidium pullulans]|uniref:Uncharacterized protein n=1 Tax=Aureobasidium pullulans TaxID=5580 RepID=A0A4S8YYQ2_AURPU|nr:hypothetical protein D6D20_08104 [Aureobasidium pullulans]THZ66378.1 hypothetical protein D6C85_08177 [Aureobasidium pullulans]